MKSRRHNQSRWAHVNTPAGLRRRRAKMDAAREALARTLPLVPPDPAPASVWQVIVVLSASGTEQHRITLHVPTAGHRCDQHAAVIDGVRELLTATAIGRLVAGMISKRPSVALQADLRREQWQEARRAALPLDSDE